MTQRDWIQGRGSSRPSIKKAAFDKRLRSRLNQDPPAGNKRDLSETPTAGNGTAAIDVREPMPVVIDGEMDWDDKVVLIVEDEKQMIDLLTIIFAREGATTHVATDGESGLRSLATLNPDLLLLDMRLPVLDGFEVLKAARRVSNLPVVIVTAISQHEFLISGFMAGADDYVKKPFRPDELLVRSWAVVRREQMNGQHAASYEDSYLSVDLTARTVKVNGEGVRLTSTEFDLFAYLLSRRGQVCTFQQILEHVWNEGTRDSAELVHVFIWQIRQKIEPNPKEPIYLVSEHSVGYRFESNPPASDNPPD